MAEKIVFKTPLQELRDMQREKILVMWEEQRHITPSNISDHRIMVGIAEELRTCVQTVYKILKNNGKIKPKQVHKPHKRKEATK